MDLTSTYCIYALLAALILCFPEQTVILFAIIGARIEEYCVNLRLKFKAWVFWRKMRKFCREKGLRDPGPFRYTDLWDREPRP